LVLWDIVNMTTHVYGPFESNRVLVSYVCMYVYISDMATVRKFKNLFPKKQESVFTRSHSVLSVASVLCFERNITYR
jgi:hypothetical protein